MKTEYCTPDELNDIISRAITAEQGGETYRYAENAEEIQAWGESAFALIIRDPEFHEPISAEQAKDSADRAVAAYAKKQPCPDRR